MTKAMHVDPAKRYADARTFRRALEQSRPQVSWWPTHPATGFGWEGAAADGTTWRAAIEPRTKGGFRFTVERRLPDKAWRKQNTDGRDTTDVEDATNHAHEVLSRIAAKGV